MPYIGLRDMRVELVQGLKAIRRLQVPKDGAIQISCGIKMAEIH